MHDFVRKPKNILGLIIVLVFIFALLYSFYSASHANLPSYNPVNDPQATEEPEESKPPIETQLYVNEELGLSMNVPADWVQVIKSGHVTFVNQADGAALQFIVSDYQPTLNSISQETVNADVQNVGGVLGGFARNDAS